MTTTTLRTFTVTLTVTGTVVAENAGDAVGELCNLIREGLGRDTSKRKYGAMIAHGEAICKSVFIPEGGKGS